MKFIPAKQMKVRFGSATSGVTKPIMKTAEVDPADTAVLVDTDHDSGILYEVNVKVFRNSRPTLEETCHVHAAYPGLACNRAWKLVNGKHKRALGRKERQHVEFTTEVL